MALPDYIPKTAKLKPLRGVEVFASGEWNGMTFTAEELAAMESAFEPTLKEVHPVVVTNHGEDTDGGINRGFLISVQRNTEPGTDYLGNAYGPGDRLEADLLIDEELHKAIEQGQYLRPSIELWPEYKSKADGSVHPWVITAVSYQGGKNIEAVRSLKPASLQMSDAYTPLHFSHGGKARLFSQATQEIKPMVDMPMGAPAEADGMQAMLTQMLDLQKGLAESLSKIASKLDATASAEKKEDEPVEEMMDKAKEDEELDMKDMEDDKKKVTMSDLQKRVTETERMLFAERKARKDEAELASATEFVHARSNQACLKIPVKFRESAAKLIATAGTPEYRESLKSLLDAVADKALLFKENSLSLSAEASELVGATGPQAAIEAKVTDALSKGRAKDKGEAYTLVFKENPTLYTEYQLAQRRARE